MKLPIIVILATSALVGSSSSPPPPLASLAFPEHRARLNAFITAANALRSDASDSAHAALQGRVNDLLFDLVAAFDSSGLHSRHVLSATVARYLRRPASVSSIDNYPKISLAFSVLQSLEYCSSSKTVNRLCTAALVPWSRVNTSTANGETVGSEVLNWAEVSEAARLLCPGNGDEESEPVAADFSSFNGDDVENFDPSLEESRITSVDNRTRAKSQLPLLRAEAARRLNALIAESEALRTGSRLSKEDSAALSFDLVLNAAQVHSIERRADASAAYCRDPRRPGWRPMSDHLEQRDSASVEPPSDTQQPPLVLAFGDRDLCSALLQSAKLAGIQVKLLPYDKNAGFRQMVPKLIQFMRSLPKDRLVVKLDGSDVMLSSVSGGDALEQRWRSLGGGVVFSAEASLFLDVGSAQDDCSWMARYPPAPTVYRFLNAGSFMGTANDIRSFMEKARWEAKPFWTSGDDQALYSTYYIRGELAQWRDASIPRVQLDHCQDLFAVMSGPTASRNMAVTDAFTFASNITGLEPLVVHFAGRRTKRRFELLKKALASKIKRPKKKSAVLIF